MASKQRADNYPGERTSTEEARLHAQHDLVVTSLGGLVLCAFDTTKENARILDIGTADGWWLHCLREQLLNPASASLLGTDIAPYPSAVEKVIIHDFRSDFPEEWKDHFDLVQLRAVLASAGSAPVDVVRRACRLVKPGGFIQLVDGTMPPGEVLASDRPSVQFFNRLGNLLVASGLDPSNGPKVTDILKEAGGSAIKDQGSKTSTVRLGKNSPLENKSWEWLRGMDAVVGRGLKAKGLIGDDEYEELRLAFFEDARSEGVEMQWHASWAQKV